MGIKTGVASDGRGIEAGKIDASKIRYLTAVTSEQHTADFTAGGVFKIRAYGTLWYAIGAGATAAKSTLTSAGDASGAGWFMYDGETDVIIIEKGDRISIIPDSGTASLAYAQLAEG